jgi:DNA-binding NarL/FixJ family response regulator
MPITVLIADDHPIIRYGFRNEIARHPDMVLVGEAEDGDTAFALMQTVKPDVALLDINMPGQKTLQILRRNQQNLDAGTRIAILTAYGDIESVVGMLNAGATGYILKDEDISEVVTAIRSIARGHMWLSPQVVQLMQQGKHDASDHRVSTMSRRELEILRVLAYGYTNRQIAQMLNISEGTVKNHIISLYDSIGVHTRAEAVAWAWLHRIIDHSGQNLIA